MLNAVDIVLIVLLALAIGLAVRKMVRDSRNGGCSCGAAGGCSGCAGCSGASACSACAQRKPRPKA